MNEEVEKIQNLISLFACSNVHPFLSICFFNLLAYLSWTLTVPKMDDNLVFRAKILKISQGVAALKTGVKDR